jgi:membrane fusion protein (multidrug efflux system)
MPELDVKNHDDVARGDGAPYGREESHLPRRNFFKRHPKAKWIVAAIAVILIIGGVLYWIYASHHQSTDDAQIAGYIAPVAPRVSGTVINVYVNDNQPVKKGDVLVQLDPRDYQVALDRAQADLADAEAAAKAAQRGVPITTTTTSGQLAIARANLDAAEKEVDAANAQLQEATANHDLAARNLERFATLLKKDEISQQQYDDAAAREQTTRAAVDAARANVATAQSHVAQARAQITQAETAPEQVSVTRSQAGSAQANVMQKQAAAEQARLNLEYTTIRAAFDGRVTNKTVQLGQIIQAGQPLMSLVPLEDIWVIANFKENQLKNMHPGDAATIHVDAYGRDYKGHVDSIAAASAAATSLLPPENATGNYVKVVQRVPVKIIFEKGQDPNHLLVPGMSVVPTVTTK